MTIKKISKASALLSSASIKIVDKDSLKNFQNVENLSAWSKPEKAAAVKSAGLQLSIISGVAKSSDVVCQKPALQIQNVVSLADLNFHNDGFDDDLADIELFDFNCPT